jgi:hypothetical protein
LKEAVWLTSWKVATAALGFDVQASLAAVAAAVKVWRDFPERRLLYESEMKRIRGMDRDITEFEQEVNRLTQPTAPDFPQIFSGTALLLSIVGIYGLLACLVN